MNCTAILRCWDCSQLASRKPKVHKSVRIWTRHAYLIVYTDRTRLLRIIRILHGARDVTNLIDDGA